MNSQKIAEYIKNLEDENERKSTEIGSVRGTLILNFGPEGKTKPGIVDKSQDAFAMLCAVFDHFKDAILSKQP